MTAMPVMIAVLCLMAIAYRYYSAFLAAKVATLDDARATPAVRLNDGQNYHPTSKWVLFGHHFAAISGAGPLIGPVLAAQFGYLPGLLWIVIGVCLAGAVQDFLVLSASIRRNGKSLAQIAFMDIGKVAGWAAMVAILFIIVIALAGLGKVVVKALGGEAVKYPAGSHLLVPFNAASDLQNFPNLKQSASGHYVIPSGTELSGPQGQSSMTFAESFELRTKEKITVDRIVTPGALPKEVEAWSRQHGNLQIDRGSGTTTLDFAMPPDAVRLVPGSSWGTFTIACTIPIALLVGLWMYRIRPGRVVEASIIGGVLTLLATFLGGIVANHPIGQMFNLKDTTVVWSMAAYGFVASVLPVWVLLCPRDYLSSFLKIGTIAILVGGTILANPKLEAPAYNAVFASGGPTVAGKIFPFLFITIMCGAISGFHALVSSGTTPKMLKRESDARAIGYGAMLIEGLVGVVAMIAAATLPTPDYYAMNTDLAKVPAFHERILKVSGGGGVEHIGDYETLTQESLRGRTGGAVTLAVGMAHIFDGAARKFSIATEAALRGMWKYWYHFAIMFEALFILTTIDTGTRIGRFLLQELGGKVIHPKLGETGWWPGAIVSTLIIVAGWGLLINYNNFMTIWGMFGIANQMLAVIALAIVSAYLYNEGRARYLWATVGPMVVVMTTTSTAAVQMLSGHIDTIRTQLGKTSGRDFTTLINSSFQGSLILAMLVCTGIVIVGAGVRMLKPASGLDQRLEVAASA